MLIEDNNEIFISVLKLFILQTFLIIKNGKHERAAKNILQNKTVIAEVVITVARAMITENDHSITVVKSAALALNDIVIEFIYC